MSENMTLPEEKGMSKKRDFHISYFSPLVVSVQGEVQFAQGFAAN